MQRWWPLRRRGPRRTTNLERELRVAWRVGAETCAVTGRRGTFEEPLEGHHVIPKSAIKDWAKAAGVTKDELAARLWDTRNRMFVTGYVHRRHTRATQRIARRFVTTDNREYARELGLEWMLDRDYPEEDAA